MLRRIILGSFILMVYSNISLATCLDKITEDNLIDEVKTTWFNPVELKECEVEILKSFYYEENGTEKCLVIIQKTEKEISSHGAGATIGVVIYIKEKSGLKEVFKQKEVTEIGNFGGAPPVRLVKIGDDSHGLVFDYGYVGMGYYEGYFILFAQVGGEYKQILNLLTDADNYGTGLKKQWSYESKVNFTKGDNRDFYDITVISKGTNVKYDKGVKRIYPYKDVKNLKFSNGVYK